ncbi:metallophosphoesterase [Capnocytophaga sputigena]|uniref:metallophosphoesterase n=1 Tax=Capnocytophaga sputigena TaxID=1019 RepID=UPI000BB19276|nr:metallophosphoesterase [Capnocytophaga sputigena]ATA71733.1 phosphoesterase [Capnocytophaga sputigena]PBN46985.1 phosphoesterase [Capnocytophaga sputigena]
MVYIILIGIFIIYFLLIFYASRSLKTLKVPRWVEWLFWLITIGVVIHLLYHWFCRGKVVWSAPQQYAIAGLLTWLIICLFVTLPLLLEDITRLIKAIFRKPTNAPRIPSRRKFVSTLGWGLAAIPFASILYSIFKGKYNYKVWKYTLYFDNLPKAFDGYRITQISDIHCGSFDNYEKIRYGVELINSQKSDVILFTGDLVNNLANEVHNWKSLFATLQAPDGVFSIMGNHDYGDYSSWETPEAKQQNLEHLFQLQKQMGWQLLLNEHCYLERNGEKIALIGVENWGHGRFSKYGDLNKAMEGVNTEDFKILMSHDPTHWQEVVLPENKDVQLTLSGHTHGMQCGIEIPGWLKWSPSQYIYKYWGGMYEEDGKYLNVNRGFGYHAFPGRLGVWPEITVIELKTK